MHWVPAPVTMEYWMVMRGGYASSGNNSVVAGLKYNGLAHCEPVWDPGPVAGQCIYVCCDCLCVIALFCSVMLLVHD